MWLSYSRRHIYLLCAASMSFKEHENVWLTQCFLAWKVEKVWGTCGIIPEKILSVLNVENVINLWEIWRRIHFQVVPPNRSKIPEALPLRVQRTQRSNRKEYGWSWSEESNENNNLRELAKDLEVRKRFSDGHISIVVRDTCMVFSQLL